MAGTAVGDVDADYAGDFFAEGLDCDFFEELVWGMAGEREWKEGGCECEKLTRLVFATGVFKGGGCVGGVICSDRRGAYGTSVRSPRTFKRSLLRSIGVRIAEWISALGWTAKWRRIKFLASQDLVRDYGERFLLSGVADFCCVGFFLGLRPFW